VIVEKDWRKVRDSIVDSMTNFGQPVITVEDGDYRRRGELFLKHAFDGKELDRDYTERVLKNVQTLWGRPVHLETTLEDTPTTFTADSDGSITGIRFYKGSGNTGTHVGELWSSTGQLLAAATFAGEERARLWQHAVAFFPPYADYHVKAGGREIPVVVLDTIG